MRSDAKASTAGSTQRRAKGLGSIFRGVFATRGASLDAEGSGASSAKRLVIPISVFAAILALMVVAIPAGAAKSHLFKEIFGSAAQPSFTTARGIAIDQSSGDVLVMDAGTPPSIERFNADGTPDNFTALGSNEIDGKGAGDLTPQNGLGFASASESQIAVDNSGTATDGNIYVTQSSPNAINVFSDEGNYLGQLTAAGATNFSEACGVAVDPAGAVYVGDYTGGIRKFVPAANPPVNADHTATFTTTTQPCTLAAGSGATAGFLFATSFNGPIKKLDSGTGEVKYTVSADSHTTLSVDPGTGHVYGATGSSIKEFDASGAVSATTVSSSTLASGVQGVGVRGASGDIYASRSGNAKVEVLAAALTTFPGVATSAATANTGTKATLNGTVNPDGVELDECFFEWGRTFSQGGEGIAENTTPCAETPAAIGTSTSPVPVHADLTGLVPNGGIYSFRLVAKNPSATINGAELNFTTPDTVITQPASGVSPTAATLNGTVNPDGEAISACVFEYGPPKEPGEAVQKYPDTAPCVPGPGGITGTSPVAVSANLSGLDIASVYHYRLKATYPSGTILGDDSTLQTAGPRIEAAWSENVVRTDATLKAAIDPEGAATTYRFEYGTSEAYGQQTPETAIGSDSSVHEVTQSLAGLTPGTAYHYRVVATSAAAENQGPDRTFTTNAPLAPQTDCPNEALRSGTSASLPDCRAYEMVSPVEKNGGDIYVASYTGQLDSDMPIRGSYNQAAIGGGKITYSSGTAFGDQTSARGTNQYIATRGANGWATHGINAPLGLTLGEPIHFLGDLNSQFKLFTPDLSRAWVTDTNRVPLTPDASEGWPNLYKRDNLTDSYEAITTSEPAAGAVPLDGSEYYFHEVQGSTADGSHVVFAVRGGLTSDTTGGNRWQTYDYSGGELHLVSVLPNGSTDPNSSSVGSVNHLFFSTERRGNVDNAISADGSRIFWTSTVPFVGEADGGPGTLYVRENPAEPQSALNGSNECTEPAKACTRLVAAGQENYFWGASADGSKVVYTVGSAGGGGGNGQLNKADVDAETTTPIAADIGGVVGMSDDASRVYFTSQEALAPGAVAGEWNLYLDHEGAKTFIATVSNSDRTGFEVGSGANVSVGGIDQTGALFKATRVTPDGRHLAFQSNRSLTGYDNTDAINGKPLIEVYHYDADGEELTCVSCNPSGARGVGYEMVEPFPLYEAPDRESKLWAAAWLQTQGRYNYASRALSDDGNRLYFNAYDGLVPEDTNGAQDVYQWEAQGIGTCQQEGGCLSLISTGKNPQKSEFVDATPDGDEVFFETLSSIDPRDPGLIDIYSARVNGGFPIPPEPPACEGDACQDIPAAPNDPTPSSASFKGAADPVAKKPRRRSCRARGRNAGKKSAAKRQAKKKKAKRCKRAKRGAGR